MTLSRRTAWDLEPTPWARAVAAARAGDRPPIDLTDQDPTRVGLSPRLRADLLPGNAPHDPAPLGIRSAREAVAREYRAAGSPVGAEDLWLTAGTSEAYSQLLSILCDPGDAVAVPRPGYPVLEYLADAQGVRLLPYPLHHDGRWWIDVDAMPTDPRLRAVIIVAPNNPTGSYVTGAELDRLDALCRERGLAQVFDSVFDLYPVAPPSDRASPLRPHDGVTRFVLSGLSKVAALPQLKLSWVLARGELAAATRHRVEVLADATLSLAHPVQHALPELLAAAPDTRARILRRAQRNWGEAVRAFADHPVTPLGTEGGWTALLRLPGTRDDLAWGQLFLETGVLVAPGYLHELDSPHASISLITPEAAFDRGLELLAAASAI